MDIFGRFARDPACLVALDAANGGSWRSPFRPGVVYPSAVPRNFATEPVTGGWRDLLKKMQEAGTPNNITFTITFENTVSATFARILYGLANSDPFGIRQESNGNITAFTAYATPYYPVTVYIASDHGGAFLTGKHTVKIEIIGTTIRVYLDDVRVGYPATVARGTPLYNTGIGSDAGYLYDIKILSDDEILWSYPSESERLRLFTTNGNVWTGNGYFEAASSATAWSIKYAAPAPTGDYTAVVDTTAAVITQVRKSGVTSTYTNGVSGGTLPYLTLATSTLSGAYGTKMRHFLLFDRALSTGEIQLLR